MHVSARRRTDRRATYANDESRAVLPAQVGNVQRLEPMAEYQQAPREAEHPGREERQDDIPRGEVGSVRSVLHRLGVRRVDQEGHRDHRDEHLRVEFERRDLGRLDLHPGEGTGAVRQACRVHEGTWIRTIPSSSSASAFIAISRGFTSSYPANGGSN